MYNDDFFSESFLEESEALQFIQEALTDPKNNDLRIKIIDPIIEVLESKSGRDRYLEYGTEFIEANADMLAREFPTKRVSFPKKYVDDILKLFGFEIKSFRITIKELCNQVNESSSFMTIMASPTNIIHAVVLFYSDMTYNRYVRDSARQQLALTVYHVIFNKFYHSLPDERVMMYTYLHLNRTFSIVRAENMMSWLSDLVDSGYGFYRTKLSINMSMSVLIAFLNRVRVNFRQQMHTLANLYFKNQEEGNRVGDDVESGADYVVTDDTTRLKENLMRLIKNKDGLYLTQSELYDAVGRLKNVSSKSLYDLAQKVSYDDMSHIIELILYVFISKEGHTIEEINSSVYMGMITNIPTKVDRCVPGEPVIEPFVKRYKTKRELAIAYICLVATWIMLKINDVT